MSFDEQRTGRDGVAPDSEDESRHDERRDHLWATMMAGSWGIEWYFGYMYPHNDLNLEDFRSRSQIWSMTRHALEFFHEHLPFEEMTSADHLAADSGTFVLAKPGEVYAVYIPTGGSARLDLEDSKGKFEVSWFSPSEGGELADGVAVSGPGVVRLGSAPGDPHPRLGSARAAWPRLTVLPRQFRQLIVNDRDSGDFRLPQMPKNGPAFLDMVDAARPRRAMEWDGGNDRILDCLIASTTEAPSRSPFASGPSGRENSKRALPR